MKGDIKVGIYENIRKIWLQTGMSQQELAERINAQYPDDRISVAGVSKIMTGAASNMTQRTMEKIAYGLGVTLADLVTEGSDISSKIAMQRLEGLSPEVIAALSDKNKFDYLLLGLELAESELSPKKVKLVISLYKEMREKLSKE